MLLRMCKEASDWHEASAILRALWRRTFPAAGVDNHSQPSNQGNPTMKRLLMAAALATALIGTPLVNWAAENSGSSPDAAPKAEKKAKRIPFRGKISAVDKVARTFTLEGKEKVRTFRVTTESRLKKDGQDAVFDDLKVGEVVGGQYCVGATGGQEAVLVNIGAKPENLEKSDRRSKQ